MLDFDDNELRRLGCALCPYIEAMITLRCNYYPSHFPHNLKYSIPNGLAYVSKRRFMHSSIYKIQ